MTFLLNSQTIGEDILSDAADQAAIFDFELAATLRDLASEYAGPYIDPEASRLLSPAYAYQKDAG